MPARWLRDSLTRNRDFMTLWAGESVSLIGGLLAERIGLRATLLVAALGGLTPLVWRLPGARWSWRRVRASAARSVAPAAKTPTI